MNKKELICKLCVLCGLLDVIFITQNYQTQHIKEEKTLEYKSKVNNQNSRLHKLDIYGCQAIKPINNIKTDSNIKNTNEINKNNIKCVKNTNKQKDKNNIKNHKSSNVKLSRGKIDNNFKIIKEIECHITYYTNINNRMEGGQHDKKGKKLTSHNEPICALPSEINYGDYLILNEVVNGSKIFKNVDTGGAIRFLNKEKTKMKVDIFVPNVTSQWICKHLENKIIKGYIVKKVN